MVVEFNKKAWANEETILRWIKHQYRHGSAYSQTYKEPRLLILDAFTIHLTEKLRKVLTDINYTASFIPDGCTGYLQVLDIALKNPLKDLVRDQAELHYDQNFEQWKTIAIPLATDEYY